MSHGDVATNRHASSRTYQVAELNIYLFVFGNIARNIDHCIVMEWNEKDRGEKHEN